MNDLELQYVNVVDLYMYLSDQWQERSRVEIKNELLQIYSLCYNSLNYQKKKGAGGLLPSKHIKRVNMLQWICYRVNMLQGILDIYW